jgi:hypothetical protein
MWRWRVCYPKIRDFFIIYTYAPLYPSATHQHEHTKHIIMRVDYTDDQRPGAPGCPPTCAVVDGTM